ncbi:hypothetical protein CANCADRAFT_17165, partial [Tortispora caseinolytica NRRL Y-17796]
PGTNADSASNRQQQLDPENLSDALLSAGVDLREEEALLSQSVVEDIPVTTSYEQLSAATTPSVASPQLAAPYTPMMGSHALASYMHSLATRNSENDLIDLVSLACEEWITHLVTSAAIVARHRKNSDRRYLTSGSMYSKGPSDLARTIRQLAIKDKEAEEKWQVRRNALKQKESTGKDGADATIADNDTNAEEAIQRATNETVALMTGSSKGKKYSWMTGSSGTSTPLGRKGSATSSDPGIRIREAREENSVMMRDLVVVLERE